MPKRTFEEILNQAIRLLTPREHSELELRRKLQLRGIAGREIDPVIARLIELGYLSDDRFAELYVSQRIRRGDGPSKIRANLIKRGISSTLIEQHLPKDQETWEEVAKNVLEKKLLQMNKTLESLTSNDWKRLYAFLNSRGFSGALSRTVLGDIPSRQ